MCLTLAPNFYGVYDPIPYPHMFIDRVCVGSLEANRAGIKKRTVEGYLRNLLQIFAGVGPDKP